MKRTGYLIPAILLAASVVCGGCSKDCSVFDDTIEAGDICKPENSKHTYKTVIRFLGDWKKADGVLTVTAAKIDSGATISRDALLYDEKERTLDYPMAINFDALSPVSAKPYTIVTEDNSYATYITVTTFATNGNYKYSFNYKIYEDGNLLKSEDIELTDVNDICTILAGNGHVRTNLHSHK